MRSQLEQGERGHSCPRLCVSIRLFSHGLSLHGRTWRYSLLGVLSTTSESRPRLSQALLGGLGGAGDKCCSLRTVILLLNGFFF